MTTNIGAHLIQENFRELRPDNVEEIVMRTKRDVFELMKQSVRPEFLNRIDELIMFRPLSKNSIRQIVSFQFKIIQNRLKQNGIKIEAAPQVLDKLGELGYDPQFGARPLKRVMQKLVLNELSKEILSGKVSNESIIGIDLNEENEIEFINLDEIKI